ncbi:MAG: hypothetical protein H6659_07080 [Ardenticatenaceae bacterium]|nr:hypothetical protein [Ardenticatenaceae bacterium]
MYLLSALLSLPALSLPAQQTSANSYQWWWLFIVGLILLVAFLYWWRRVSEEDLEKVVAFEQQHPQALAMPEGFTPPPVVIAPVSSPDDHDVHDEEGEETEVEAEETAVSAPPAPDNLERIEGIGPKIAEILNQDGIYTFAQLAEADVAHLQALLEEAGPRYQLADPSTWPQQAKLATLADWAALEELQETLKGGRQTA